MQTCSFDLVIVEIDEPPAAKRCINVDTTADASHRIVRYLGYQTSRERVVVNNLPQRDAATV